MDLLWLVNGIVFYALLFATTQWHRLVPTAWSVFPDALSVLIQYLSLNWPVENTWVAYNGLQLIAYFVTVFVAAPLALVTGLGMSPALSARFKRLSKVLSIQVARSVHFLVLVYFVVFIVIHVSLVFATGLLVNLNHVYAGRTDHSWVGFWLFAVSMAVIIVAWVSATPGLCSAPARPSSGWSGVAKWGGVSMQTIMDLVRPRPEAKWVVFYSLGEGADKGVYYDAHPIEHMGHHLTMLAYDMNGEPLSFGHGAPLRLRNENELGFKQVKWIKGIEFVTHYSEIGSGYGGYSEDHEFFGYRQSI
jgi:hypothetical protein